MDGYTATRLIRAEAPQVPRTPIVALTAHAVAADKAKAIASGMDDYITKPITGDRLKSVLLKFVR
jgi:CheY-like chemotaxis protein